MTNYKSKIKAVLKKDGLGDLPDSDLIIINNMLNREKVVTDNVISQSVHSYIDGVYSV